MTPGVPASNGNGRWPRTLPTVPAELACRIRDSLHTYRFRFATEEELQRAVDATLGKMVPDASVIRDAQLTRHDRIHFLVGRLGIQVKCDGGLDALRRQLYRYLEHGYLEALLLVTDKPRLTDLPYELLGKPIKVFCIGTP